MCNEVQACASLQRIMGRMNDPPLLRIGRKENALAKEAGPWRWLSREKKQSNYSCATIPKSSRMRASLAPDIVYQQRCN